MLMSTLGAKNEELTMKLLNSLKTYVRYSIILDMTSRRLRLCLGRWWCVALWDCFSEFRPSSPPNLVLANGRSGSVSKQSHNAVHFVTTPVQAYARPQIANSYSHSNSPLLTVIESLIKTELRWS